MNTTHQSNNFIKHPHAKLKKTLTLQQEQAYAGAQSFYKCFLPLIMLTSLSLHILLLVSNQKEGKELNYLPLAASVITFLFYWYAKKYYQLCNSIDTTPILLDEQTEHSSKQFGQFQQSSLINQKPQPRKCQKCKIICDYRTKHCRKCQVCIQRYDHHCFWIGNCVGRHNHRVFLHFLLFQTFNNILNFYSLYYLQPIFQLTWLSSMTAVYFCYLAIVVLAFGFVVFTGYLLGYHVMLVCYGLTTWQHMRRNKIDYLNYLPIGFNPFSRGVIENIKLFFSERTRYRGECSAVSWGELLPTFEQSKQIRSGCNLIENEYYSCC